VRHTAGVHRIPQDLVDGRSVDGSADADLLLSNNVVQVVAFP
jgi:hypothetical protein